MDHAPVQATLPGTRIHDLKNDLGEFCSFWECSRLRSEKACTFCPVVKDINDMVDDQQLQPAAWLPSYTIY